MSDFKSDREPRSDSHAGSAGAPELSPAGSSVMRKSLRNASYDDAVQMLSPGGEAAVAASGLQGPSMALPAAGRIGSTLGADVSNVQAYSGPAAQAACQSLGAEAYTMGGQVAFGTTSPSVGLQAHEAAHVVQQRGGATPAVQRKGGTGGDVQLEAEADQAAEAVEGGPTEEDKAAEEARVAKAQADYEALLGETIGGALFEQIREHLSADDLLGYAKQGTQAAADNIGSLGDLIGSAGENWDGAAATKFLEALGPKIQELANGWLESDSGQGVMTKISQWVEESPGGVTAIAATIGALAIGAAIAAYMANMDPPEFGHMFKIGDSGLAVGGKIDVGAVQNLAVQAATLTVRYQREGLNIEASSSYDDDEGFSGQLSMKGEADLGSAGLTGEGLMTIAEDGTVHVKVTGGINTVIAGTPVEAGMHAVTGDEAAVGGSLVIGDEAFAQRLTGTFSLGSSDFTLRTEYGNDTLKYFEQYQMGESGLTTTEGLTLAHDTTKFTYGATSGPEGDGSTMRLEDSSIGGSGVSAYGQIGTGSQEGYQLGLGYRNDLFRTQFDLAMGETTTLGTETSLTTPEGVTAGFGAKLDLDESLLQDFHVKFGFTDPDEFRGFLLQYRLNWASDNAQYQHQVDAMMEQSIGIVNTRLSGTLKWDDDGVSGGGIEALAGVPVGGGFQVLSGLGYQATMNDEAGVQHRPQISAGLQYQSVNLLLDWQPPVDSSMPDAGVFGLRAVIPLGR